MKPPAEHLEEQPISGDASPAPTEVVALAAEPAFLEAAYRSIGEGLTALDVSGRVVHLNLGAEGLLGWRQEDLIGRRLHDVVHHFHPDGSDYPAENCPLLAVIGNGRNTVGDETFIRSDGYTVPITFSSAPIVIEGTVVGSVITFRDVGVERAARASVEEADQLRLESRRLAELDRIKSEFLNLVAHELRSPLAVARGYASMLADGTFGPLHATDASTAVPIINAKLTEMNALVDQMLETARLEAGHLHLSKTTVSLRAIVDDALRTMAPLARNHRLVSGAGPPDDMVYGDPNRVLTIMTNLIENACKYSPPETDVEVRIWREAGWVGASVEDRGWGIAPQHLNKIFSKFGRVVTPDNSHILGSGLGLYLCRDLARMHGGDLTVRSEVGRGSVFSLRLPAHDDPLG